MEMENWRCCSSYFAWKVGGKGNKNLRSRFQVAEHMSILLGIPATGDVLIIAQRRGSTQRHNILRGSAKPPTFTGESQYYLEIKKEYNKYMKEDLITQLPSLLLPCSSSCSLLSCTHSRLLSQFCSQIIASFIGKHGNLLQHSCQIWWDKQALKYATICGINGATTNLVVGYCH